MKTLLIILILIGAVALALVALSKKVAGPNQRFLDYRAHLQRLDEQNQPAVDERVREEALTRFAAMWASLTAPRIREQIRSVYDDSIWFNDTVHTITDLDHLEAYMVATADRVDSCQVTIDQIVHDGPDTFIRWWMTIRTPGSTEDEAMVSAGMSHLRFSPEGRVILHQDFWDAAGGLYEHFPGVGWILRQIRARL